MISLAIIVVALAVPFIVAAIASHNGNEISPGVVLLMLVALLGVGCGVLDHYGSDAKSYRKELIENREAIMESYESSVRSDNAISKEELNNILDQISAHNDNVHKFDESLWGSEYSNDHILINYQLGSDGTLIINMQNN